MRKNGHYKEIGDVGSISNTIQLDNWGCTANVDEYFDFVVRGEYVNEST